MLRTLRCSAAAAALGLGLVLAAGAPATAAPHGVKKTDPNGRFTAEEIHHFLEGFYGNHGPRPWERENLVSDQLKERIAQTPDYDLLLCAQNEPRDIEVGEVTTAQSARVGWATITTYWGQGSPSSFTAYVDLDASRPIELLDVDCATPEG
ncbi:hypothetical protein SSOG_05726 [Streptomyces himastatinicus ATCC 53653]|uniref:Secreted protein n=1 Tax=Streptomyces himastatinicus ATCC 53653 TaxID=457427 RepID=D9WQ52_9ACTN|nr:hypothetical protein [Streptomyces himastatinicus]EFL26012.1 hypothetical protein SSOG_05726 [Streptomyces himastatinicus ATCC 53653]